MATGGELLVGALAAAGVEVAFGLPGVHNLAAWNAFASSTIRLVGVRHEQAAAYAADGYARATGRVGVAIVTTGPGAANTVCATGEAWACGSPLLVIATDIPTGLRRPATYRGVLHETTDQGAMFAPVTKAAVHATEAATLPSAVQWAVRSALTPPTRPVYLEVPTDLLSAEAEAAPDLPMEPVAPSPLPQPDLDRAADLLAGARRPLVWAGGGAVRSDAGAGAGAGASPGAGAAIGELARRLGAPVIETFQGRGLVPPEHPCAVGLPPHVPEVGRLWDEADAVVAIGTDFDGTMTQNWLQPAPPRLVTINVDPVDAAKNYRPDVLLTGDAAAVVPGLTAALPAAPDSDARALQARLSRLRSAVWDRLRAEHPRAVEFLDTMAAVLPDDARVIADMCIPGYWLGGFHRVCAPRTLMYPIGWGTLGFAFPAALGVALSQGGPVVSVSGDGGFLYSCGELATAAQERISLTAVIVDDGGYGMLRFDQRQSGHELYGVDLHTPDFAALARSFGVRAEAVDSLGTEFGAALAEQLSDPAPTILVARAALDPPPTTSPRWYRKS